MLQRVNFYGHAVVASWFRTEPAFVLGAMLPDFLTMLGRARATFVTAPSAHTDASVVLTGVEFHHATDAAFHELPEFLALTAAARDTLSRGGLSRGAARGVAHIGIEILLDELLTADEVGRSTYFSALAHTQTAELPLALSPDEHRELRELTDLLSRRGLPESPSPLEVAERLQRIVAKRPRLAFEATQSAIVGAWVDEARPSVRTNAPAILAALRKHLH